MYQWRGIKWTFDALYALYQSQAITKSELRQALGIDRKRK